MKPKILFIAPLPPPVHGSAMVSQYIKDSKLVNEQFDCDFVNLSTSRRMDEIGKGGIKKLLRFIGSYFAVFFKLLTHRYNLCYLAITCHGVGFLKDAPFVLLCKLFGRKVLIHQHNKGMSGCVDRWPYRWLIPLVYRNTKVMLLSWHLYPDIEKVVGRDQVVICPNGIPELADCRLQTTDDRQQTTDCHPEGDSLAVTKTNTASRMSTDGSQLNNEVVTAHSPQLIAHSSWLIDSKLVNSHTDCTDYTETISCQRDLNEITQNTRCCARVGHPVCVSNENCHPDGVSEMSAAPSLRGRAGGEAPNLLFLSNLIESKGVYVLLDACKVLRERGLQFMCDFVGGETKEIDRAVFEAEVKERGLEDCVAYHGPQYGEDKLRFFAQADVFVFPTFYYNECFPLVLLEAMQYRLPMVSSDEGGIPDIVQNRVNGFVAERKNVTALADALEKLIVDPALRHQMGEQGYARYKEKYTLEAFEACFVECLASGEAFV